MKFYFKTNQLWVQVHRGSRKVMSVMINTLKYDTVTLEFEFILFFMPSFNETYLFFNEIT